MSSNPKDLELEELLKVLASSPEPTTKEENASGYKNDILGFLHFFDIKEGTIPIRRQVLYRIYKEWSENPVKSPSFARQMGEFFPLTDTRYYYLNHSTVNLKGTSYKRFIGKRRDRTKSPKYREHFEKYLSVYNISAGKTWFPSFVLYYLYDKWTYEKNLNTHLSEEMFERFLVLYFKQKTTNRGTNWFQINKDIYNVIPKDKVFDMIISRKTYGKKRHKAEKI